MKSPATTSNVFVVGLVSWNCRVGCAGLQYEQGAGLTVGAGWVPDTEGRAHADTRLLDAE